MLSDKQTNLDFKQNPGVLIGKDEMEKFMVFVNRVTRKNEPANVETNKVS